MEREPCRGRTRSEDAVKKVYLDHTKRCSCKHTLGMHTTRRPFPCRARDCGCEGFFLVDKKGRIITA